MIKVSILIPVYNQEELLERCLNSIPARPDIEIVIVDDCSTDNTKNILAKYNNIKVITNTENKGIGACRNILIENSIGEYIFFLDSDDYIYTETFNDIIKHDLKNQNILMPACRRNDGFTWFPGVHRGDFLKRSFISQVKHTNKRCHEDSQFRNDLQRLPGYHIEYLNKIVYHYNEPRIGSLTWEDRKQAGVQEYQAGIEEWERIRKIQGR